MIDTFFKYLKKGLISFIFLAFAVAALYTPISPVDNIDKADAIFSTLPVQLLQYADETIDTVAGVASEAWDAINTAANKAMEYKNLVGDSIYWVLAKAILSVMLSSLVKWINSGFKGSPMFVQDIKQYLIDTADEAVMDFLNSSNLSGVVQFLCSPFKLSVKLAATIAYTRGRDNTPRGGGCSLTDIADNVGDFISNTRDAFSQKGGWDSWFSITANPTTYTPYGSVLEVQSQVDAVVKNAKGDELEILRFGQGFLSTKVCEGASNSNSIACSIVNPGKVISEALNNHLDSSRESLVAADEVGEVLTALFQQIALKLVTGVSGLLAGSEGTGRTVSGLTVEEMDQQVKNEVFNGIGVGNVSKELDSRICELKKLAKDIGRKPGGPALSSVFDISIAEKINCPSNLTNNTSSGTGNTSTSTGSSTQDKFNPNLVDSTDKWAQYLARLMQVERGAAGKNIYRNDAAKEINAILGSGRAGADGILFNLEKQILKLQQWKSQIGDLGNNIVAGDIDSYSNATVNASLLSEISSALNDGTDAYSKGPGHIYSLADISIFRTNWSRIAKGTKSLIQNLGPSGLAEKVVDIQYKLEQALQEKDYIRRLNNAISRTNNDPLKADILRDSRDLKSEINKVTSQSKTCSRKLTNELRNHTRAVERNDNISKNKAEKNMNQIMNETDNTDNSNCYTEQEIDQYITDWDARISSIESRLG